MNSQRNLSAFIRFLTPVGLLAAVSLGSMALPARADLIGLYRFNDPTNLGKDTSGHNNDATDFGATFTASGYQGGAASFSGTTYLTSPIDVNPSALPQLTWGAWARPSATDPIRTVLSADNAGYDRDINIDPRGGSVAWSAFTGSGVLGSGVTPSTTGFTFLAAVYDQSANALTFYVDGQSFATTSSFGPSNTFFDIGHNPLGDEFFNGTIDNVFVYNQALTANDIATIRANGFPTDVPEPGTVALLVGLGITGAAFLRHRRASHRR